jgi:hypothetical protein
MTVTRLNTASDHPATYRLRSAVRRRLVAVAARRELRRELASYTTPVEVGDLLAAVGDKEDTASRAMRSILIGNLQRCV